MSEKSGLPKIIKLHRNRAGNPKGNIMNQYKYSNGKRAIAAGAAILTAAAGVLISSSAANAAPVPGPVTAAEGSLTIHKHLNPGFNGVDQNPDGSEGDGGSPLDGVTFEVCLIGADTTEIDLINDGNEAWDEVRTLGSLAANLTDGASSIGAAPNDHNLSNCTSKATDTVGTESGIAKFEGLDVGAYLVREIDAPETVVEHSAPFVVTVPTPAVGDDIGEWIYDVHVYPKNQALGAPSKKIENQGASTAVLGDNIDYRVTQVLPGVAGAYTELVMTDTLDAKLDPVTTETVTVSVTKIDATVVDLVVDTDFTAVWSGQTLTVTFLTSGLVGLLEGDTVTFGFTAKANANGEIANVAVVNVNDLEVDGTVGMQTPPVETRWGAVDLAKVNASAPDSAPFPGLEGAEFELYMGSTDAAGCSTATTGNTLVASNIVSGTDGALGTITGTTFTALPGLWVDDSSTTTDFAQRCYFLVETQAPAGFVLPADAADRTTEFIVHPETTAHAEATVEIENEQQTVPELPLTGGVMQTMLLLTGGGLIATALGLLIVRRRQTAGEPTA